MGGEGGGGGGGKLELGPTGAGADKNIPGQIGWIGTRHLERGGGSILYFLKWKNWAGMGWWELIF